MKMLKGHYEEIQKRCSEYDTEDRRALYRASGLTAGAVPLGCRLHRVR